MQFCILLSRTETVLRYQAEAFYVINNLQCDLYMMSEFMQFESE